MTKSRRTRPPFITFILGNARLFMSKVRHGVTIPDVLQISEIFVTFNAPIVSRRKQSLYYTTVLLFGKVHKSKHFAFRAVWDKRSEGSSSKTRPLGGSNLAGDCEGCCCCCSCCWPASRMGSSVSGFSNLIGLCKRGLACRGRFAGGESGASSLHREADLGGWSK
eukprot:c16349_g1_i2.p1 GENE.c16349_g1_i2~~c16349_g1_i2.p1  ORF type:complete len:165 (-),score=11.63 c16349_g1_i2:67-561(-)